MNSPPPPRGSVLRVKILMLGLERFLDLTMDNANEFLPWEVGIAEDSSVSFLPDVLEEKTRKEGTNQIEGL